MRIGELAALVGISTRAVRHYHHLGLLPDPVRLANGYRDYGLRDAVALARVRRLGELGLSLPEIRSVLADDQGRELREVLLELDADLARQQQAIAARRARLARLLADGSPHPDSVVSPEMAEVLRGLDAHGSAVAALDRELLALADTTADPAGRAAMIELFRPLAEPAARARGHALYARLDELAGAEPDDPRVPELAADLAAHLPDGLAAAMVAELPASPDGRDMPAGEAAGPAWAAEMLAALSPAQAEVLRRTAAVLAERGPC
ncbi:MerR family transcriptional regulator [Sphaerisporangium rufum]|uniref:MerR family transcriptional regulator n=1 Tax=Sphaerisporangium rufum TaxID=1381558 RepID=A0A919R0X8_9ACTN|nr:MerR family transcriptional regulator [Sphaerisporangium rufum]GII76958.1 MerR family transcriptional regulator [Sphaerisporangium rufum]